jgi:FixJ family two-component response regulator
MDMARTTQPADKPKILLLEDDPGVRRSTQLLLQAQGFDVRAYAEGRFLLADKSTTEAACLVVDYRMEELDGISVLLRMRERNWSGSAILITAFPSPDLEERAREAGFFAVLEKPMRPHTLVETISRVLLQRV